MKFTLKIQKDREEELLIYAHEDRPVFEEIRRMLQCPEQTLVGYNEENIVILSPAETVCFITEKDRVYALVGKKRYLVKKRLYQIEELLNRDYVRINQGCIANLKQISRFAVSIGGSLEVIFSNGYRDFVSRRELKKVKERIGIV